MRNYVNTFKAIIACTILSCSIYNIRGIKQNSPDPCADSKISAASATSFSKDTSYIKAKMAVTIAAVDGKEHGISFGKDANGNIITSAMSSGDAHSSKVESVPNKFADLHNHQDDSPPFSGDLYGFIDLVIRNSSFQTRYIVTQNGTVYALIITDLQTAINFNTEYPKIANPGYQPRFPDALVDEFRLIRYGRGATEERAIAFILEKYNTGVALLKQDSSGFFKKLNTREIIDAGGNKIYIANNCL